MPAVRRRCSHGVHKDRRFYVCGLERNQRCNYFKWSSEAPESALVCENKLYGLSDSFSAFAPFQMELQRIFSAEDLHKGFCDLVSRQFDQYQAAVGTSNGISTSEGPSRASFPSIKTEMEKRQENIDGVYRTLEKFGKTKPKPSQPVDDMMPSPVAEGTAESFLCSSLDLFSLIAPTENSSSWCSYWFPVLCEIISRSSMDAVPTGKSNALRQLAKKMLLRLCGDRQEVNERVRDHYVFGFQVYYPLFLTTFKTFPAYNLLISLNSSESCYSGLKIFLNPHLLCASRQGNVVRIGRRTKFRSRHSLLLTYLESKI